MTRFLLAVTIALTIFCGFQWRSLQRLKAELATADARAAQAAVADLHSRRDEIVRALTWLDASRKSSGRGGLCTAAGLDTASIGAQVFDVYLAARAKGATEAVARQRVLDAR